MASVRLLIHMGADPERILMVDRQGVIHADRANLDSHHRAVARQTTRRTLAETLRGADVLLGLSGPDLVSADMIASMAPRPIVFALANPVPEIRPDDAFSVRGDLIMATGRSDYPNQVNNVLGFPFIFRGALDARARRINVEMNVAAVYALRDLARAEVPSSVLAAYGLDHLVFGPDYIIPKPLDPRLRACVAPAVAAAAVASGVIRNPYPVDHPPMM
ncbi:NADP(+)-dependent malate dehydrogenase (fragment) [Gammaproteobacteria bacterium]